MTEKSYFVRLNLVNPTKLGSAINKEYIIVTSEDTKSGILQFKSSFGKREIKLKLGLTSETDIIEIQNSKHPIQSNTEIQTNKNVETKSTIDTVSDTASVKSEKETETVITEV